MKVKYKYFEAMRHDTKPFGFQKILSGPGYGHCVQLIRFFYRGKLKITVLMQNSLNFQV